MERIDTENRAIDLFGAGKDGFKAAVPGVSDPTLLSADFMNGVQESICRVIEAAGLALSPDHDQLKTAITQLTSGAAAAAATAASAAAASAAQIDTFITTPSNLYTALADPLLPLPAFIEGWALNSFHGVSYASPTAAGIPLDAMSNSLLEYVVSGVAGANTLTISSGDVTKGTGAWGAVVQHDDGTYGAYTVSGVAAGVCTVFPNVRATITNKTLGNLGGLALGQHYSERGYKALARKIYATTRSSAYRMRRAAKWDSSDGAAADWTAVGGIGGQFSTSIINNFLGDAAYRGTGSFISRGRRILQVAPSAAPIGKGVSKTFALGGTTGFLEAFASCSKFGVTPNMFAPFRCQVVVDGVTLLDQTFTENHGLQRIVVPYTAGVSATVTFTLTDATVLYPGGIAVGDVTFWAYDRIPQGFAWTDPVIDKNAKTVVLGDSWTTFYPSTVGGKDGALVRELQAAMTGAGGTGTVVGVGTGGTDAEFGLTEFDSKVAPELPKQVVICYFTNDHNEYSDYGYARWLTAMYKLGRRCQAIGARPIFVMPLPTQSGGQTVGHGIWADEFGAGMLP